MSDHERPTKVIEHFHREEARVADAFDVALFNAHTGAVLETLQLIDGLDPLGDCVINCSAIPPHWGLSNVKFKELLLGFQRFEFTQTGTNSLVFVVSRKK